jgi:hypothetical protein
MLINLKKILLTMSYLSEILVCRRVKEPVKMYIDISAHEEHERQGRHLAEDIFHRMQKEGHLAYLGSSAAFGGENIVYADKNPDPAIKAHEEWHNSIASMGLASPAGDFIEEASATVIEAVIGGYGKRYMGVSSSFIQTQLLVQNCTGEDLEKILDRFSQNILPQWDDAVFTGSNPWLRFIEDSKYLLLFDLCFDICANRGVRASKGIYKTALKQAKKKGFDTGLKYLQEYASPLVARLYDFEFEIDNYFPDYQKMMNDSFCEGKIKIEIFGDYKTWVEPVEKELRAHKLKKD